MGFSPGVPKHLYWHYIEFSYRIVLLETVTFKTMVVNQHATFLSIYVWPFDSFDRLLKHSHTFKHKTPTQYNPKKQEFQLRFIYGVLMKRTIFQNRKIQSSIKKAGKSDSSGTKHYCNYSPQFDIHLKPLFTLLLPAFTKVHRSVASLFDYQATVIRISVWTHSLPWQLLSC